MSLIIKHVWHEFHHSMLTGKQKRGMTVVLKRDPSRLDEHGVWRDKPAVFVHIAYCSKNDSYGRKKGVEVALSKPRVLVMVKDLPRYLAEQAEENKVPYVIFKASWMAFALRAL